MEIKPADVKQLILDEDDFGFEMRVGSALTGSQHNRKSVHDLTSIETPEHGGTYTDSISGKLRQFDYRCKVVRFEESSREGWCALLAVESKNLHKSAPLVICGRERRGEESYYAAIESYFNDFDGAFSSITRRITSDQFYRSGQFFGKSLLRMKVKKSGKVETLEPDHSADIYDGWSQAIASSVDLAETACMLANARCKKFRALVLPIVVVPDGTLWKVEYNYDGSIQKDPTKIDQGEFFVERKFCIRRQHSFVLTHVHFVTLRGLSDLLSVFWKHSSVWQWIFPPGIDRM